MTIYDFTAEKGTLYGNGREVEFDEKNKAELVLDGRLYTLTKYDNPDNKEQFSVSVERTALSLDEARALKGSSLTAYTLDADADKINIKSGVEIPQYAFKTKEKSFKEAVR